MSRAQKGVAVSARHSLPVLLLWGALVGGVALFFGVMIALPSYDVTFGSPSSHFYIVSGVSLCAVALAVLASIATIRIADGRVLLLALSFISMAGIFAMHGLTTPGFIVDRSYYTVTGFSARLSLLLATALLAASAIEVPGHRPRLRAVLRAGVQRRGSILVASGLLIAAYGTVALRWPHAVPPRLMSEALFLDGSLALVTSLGLFAAGRYLVGYRRSGLPAYGAVALGALLLVEAQLAMHYGRTWQASWWLYHVALLAAFLTIGWSFLAEYARGRSMVRTFEGLTQRDPVLQIRAGYTDSVAALSASLEARDGYTIGHGERVSALAVLIGHQMKLAPARLRALGYGALLHDVGKIGTPDAVLHKNGMLSPEEYEIIRGHPVHGEQILSSARAGAVERAVVRYHHERWDGSGYPDGLREQQIPLEARITAVADVYDALRSARAYRAAWNREAAVLHIEEDAGRHFDPVCVTAFLQVVSRWEERFANDHDRYVAHRYVA